jgi:hypothetical protein
MKPPKPISKPKLNLPPVTK